ncbi:MAG TPA: thiolase family protein [Polyangiaceae bacterium]|jgi:acetyl-CoA acyltransferase|nr:MAG: 3-ketoacyl-CoA thiolase [Deltaproteobacteria bacterium ADurb.Bin207]HNS98428.1 thiolase family protein [Polyangiaceae bacterium]HNZ22306.1 thiolase family protein [Polyangiaceae bacterium]HOD20840.1 thiolase family protein [Polyangiaceae bacterium]HOE49122.1 thiolase family protein [Polyangiaceae bacterium]
MREVVIAASYRSACGRAHKGTLALTRPDDLLAQVIAGVLERVPQIKPEMIEDVVIGCAMPEAEQGMNVARCSAMLAGLPQHVPAITTNRFCSSGLQAIATAAHQIAFGEMDIALAGGVESMTMVPMGGNKLTASAAIMDRVAAVYTPMGITAENVAKRFEVSRAVQDEFAYHSQIKAATASQNGLFRDEIIPVKATRYATKNGVRVRDDVVFDTEELPRMDTTLEGLAALRPAFSATGSVTAGNSSPLTDGAAISLLTTKERAQQLGLEILAYFRGFQVVGVDPEIMGVGPAYAVPKLLTRYNLTLDDIDLVEMNEAFASQSVYCLRQLGLPAEKVNVNGGAIALGHPLGATGAKLTATLLHEMKRRNAKRGIVTMCIGGGMGAAGLFERP